MLSDEFPEYGALSPQSLGATPVSIHLYVEDVDSLAAQAALPALRLRLRPRTMSMVTPGKLEGSIRTLLDSRHV